MGVNFLGFNIPTSAAELGSATRNDAINTAGAVAAPFYNGGAAIGGGLADFFRGLAGNPAPAAAAAAPVAVAPAGPAPVKAPVYTQAYLDKQPNFVDQWNQANPGKAIAVGPSAAPAAPAAAAAAAPAANSFSDMVARLAAGQGGGISLRQMGALAQAQQAGSQADYIARGGPSAAKASAPGDAAGHMLEQMYVNQFAKSLSDPKADPSKAQDEFEKKVLQLRKSKFIDPYGLTDGGGG